jgi:Asp-tRNA(Asn)/Glu-tRNA(Gln) amidotransferase A subunit family amidase
MLLNELSATEAARRIAERSITSEQLVRACLDRIEKREPAVHAWSSIDPDAALRQARERDAGPVLGPLHGVPVAVKDVLDTYELKTEMGSPIYAGHQPRADASCVALVRAAGAVILGKTVTAEFAHMAPGPTTNPHNPRHTPGGSSSGSAAAVADFMAPVAFGTQTGGSVQRPSAYCGVVGYKPTFNAINRAGLKFAAEHLDTIGLMARTLDDISLVRGVLVGASSEAPDGAPLSGAPRIGVCRTYLWSKAAPETRAALEDAAARLREAGAQVEDFTLPDEFGGLTKARDVVNDVERARAMAWEWQHHRDRLSPQLTSSITSGLATPYEAYMDALRLAEHCRVQLDMLLAGFDVLLAPSATGEAPAGLEWTGDSTFQGLWTLLHVPTLSLPTHRGPNGLPVGVQIISARYRDEALLRAASWVWNALAPAASSQPARALVA